MSDAGRRHVSGPPVRRPPGAVRRRLASGGLQPELPGDAGQQPGGAGGRAGAALGRRGRRQHGPSAAAPGRRRRRRGVLGAVVHGAAADAAADLVRARNVSQTAAELPPAPTAATTGKLIGQFSYIQ